MLKSFLLFLSRRQGLKQLMVAFRPTRDLTWRFVAGETLADCVAAVKAVNAKGLTATLDHLGENVTSEALATASADAYIKGLEAIAAEKLDANVSLKLTQMGLDLGEAFTYGNVRRIIQRAKELGIFVRIDMESSEYVDQTLALLKKFRAEHEQVGIVLQSYLYRTPLDLSTVTTDWNCRVRMVKGAYKEPKAVAFQKKSQVDEEYLARSREMLIDARDHGRYHAFATHDEAMIAGIKKMAEELQVPKSAYEFQMLYGIRRDLQDGLRAEGWNVRVYIPYGTDWYPYLMRRMAERPANLIFVMKNMVKG